MGSEMCIRDRSKSVVVPVLHDFMICGRDARAPSVMPIPANISSIAGLESPI